MDFKVYLGTNASNTIDRTPYPMTVIQAGGAGMFLYIKDDDDFYMFYTVHKDHGHDEQLWGATSKLAPSSAPSCYDLDSSDCNYTGVCDPDPNVDFCQCRACIDAGESITAITVPHWMDLDY